MIVALPDANQTFREITFNIIASGAESDIKPRVFFTSFPNRVLYVRDIQPDTGWRDVFLADATQPDHTTVFWRKPGRLVIDRAEADRRAGARERHAAHHLARSSPSEYDGDAFESTVLKVDPETIFPRTQIVKGDNEKTIAELRADDRREHAQEPAGQQPALHHPAEVRACRSPASCWR